MDRIWGSEAGKKTPLLMLKRWCLQALLHGGPEIRESFVTRLARSTATQQIQKREAAGELHPRSSVGALLAEAERETGSTPPQCNSQHD